MEFTKVAQVLKSNGTDGELVLGFRNISPDDISTEEPVFIFFDGLPVPFFISELKRKGQNKALVRFTDIISSADAEEIAGQAVYMDSESIESTYPEDDFSMLVGWTLLDAEGNTAGTVRDYMDIPGNPCLEISLPDTGNEKPREVMIPLHEDLILSVDEERREIMMEIPSGLI